MMQEDPENRVDPMSTVFPRVTKCTFKKFGKVAVLVPMRSKVKAMHLTTCLDDLVLLFSFGKIVAQSSGCLGFALKMLVT